MLNLAKLKLNLILIYYKKILNYNFTCLYLSSKNLYLSSKKQEKLKFAHFIKIAQSATQTSF